jgi:hypothetical protein
MVPRLLRRVAESELPDHAGAVQGHLPCDCCREVDCFKGVRLGKHERRILQSAVGEDERAAVLLPEGTTRAAVEAHNRAVRKLRAAGLLATYRPGWFQGHRQRVQLTPLGAAVLSECRPYFKRGMPIRWAQLLPKIQFLARKTGADLLREFGKYVESGRRMMGCLLSLNPCEENAKRAARLDTLAAALKE